MKRILIIYSATGKLERIARGLAAGAEEKGCQVKVVGTDEKPAQPITFHPYDLILAGSPTRGLFKGKIAEDLAPFLKKCKRTGGQEAVAFVTPGLFGTSKALKKVMAELEKLGCIVNNFTSLKNYDEAVEFGENLMV